jgi:hypothetical protein
MIRGRPAGGRNSASKAGSSVRLVSQAIAMPAAEMMPSSARPR